MGRNPAVGRQGPAHHAADHPDRRGGERARREADPLGDRPPGDDAADAPRAGPPTPPADGACSRTRHRSAAC